MFTHGVEIVTLAEPMKTFSQIALAVTLISVLAACGGQAPAPVAPASSSSSSSSVTGSQSSATSIADLMGDWQLLINTDTGTVADVFRFSEDNGFVNVFVSAVKLGGSDTCIKQKTSGRFTLDGDILELREESHLSSNECDKDVQEGGEKATLSYRWRLSQDSAGNTVLSLTLLPNGKELNYMKK